MAPPHRHRLEVHLARQDRNILVDCGLFQGLKNLRQRNWEDPPFDVRIDAVVLTHAHIDHSGYLPVLMKRGYKGPIYCTEATADLCGILLPDSGHLQEEEARYVTKHKKLRATTRHFRSIRAKTPSRR